MFKNPLIPMMSRLRTRLHVGMKLTSVVLILFIVILFRNLQMNSSPEQWFPKHLERTTFNSSSYINRFPLTRTNLNRTLAILLWTPLFGDKKWWLQDLSTAFSNCEVSDCVLSNQATDVVQADAILCHAYDFRKTFLGYEMPIYRRENQVYIFTTFESPVNRPISQEFDGLFNWTFTYRTDSDFQFQHGFFKKLAHRKPAYNVASTKSAGIAWMASNCRDFARRQLLVRELQKYINVDTYGLCGENRLAGNANKVLRKYKFYLSFENSNCRDYITEKCYRPFTHHSLPVVSGGGDYTKIAPPHSYIDIRDFKNIREVAIYLMYLDSNDTAYNSYFQWTKDFTPILYEPYWCRLCETLHDNSKVHQVYTDMGGYINDDICPKYTVSEAFYQAVHGYAITYGLV